MQNEAELADVLGHEVDARHRAPHDQGHPEGQDEGPRAGRRPAAAASARWRSRSWPTRPPRRCWPASAAPRNSRPTTSASSLSNKVGYDPHGLGAFLTRLKERNSGNTAEKRGLFASHPEMDERLKKLDAKIASAKLDRDRDARGSLQEDDHLRAEGADRDRRRSLTAPPGSRAAVRRSPPTRAPTRSRATPPAEEKKKGRFGLGKLMPGSSGGEEKKSAQVTGSGAGRGVDQERNAKGGDNPAIVAVDAHAEGPRGLQEGRQAELTPGCHSDRFPPRSSPTR